MQQHQHPEGIALAVVQTGGNQVCARTIEGLQQAPVVAGLVEADRADRAGAAAGRLLQPRGQFAGDLVVAGYGVLAEAVLGAAEKQAMRFQASVVGVDQVDQAAVGRTDGHGFFQHALEQGIETGFGGEAGGDVEETGNGLLHSRHGLGQLMSGLTTRREVSQPSGRHSSRVVRVTSAPCQRMR
ncbi:hypothetical protein D3C80_1363850 [compost metagenome]